jgi:Tripartite tricarboxylate transporter family receptor
MMARPKIILLWQPARRRKIMRPSHAIVCALLAAGLGAHAAAAAESWPTRPLTMVVPFAAGGGTDVMGRIVGRRLSELLGQQVIIENVGGAGGMVGSARVAKAAPDGYTFVLGSRADAINQTLYKTPLYNLATDLAPVVLIADQPTVLVARKDLPVTPRRARSLCNTAPPAPAPPGMSIARCSMPRWGSISRTCRIAAAARRCRI